MSFNSQDVKVIFVYLEDTFLTLLYTESTYILIDLQWVLLLKIASRRSALSLAYYANIINSVI